MDPRATGIVGLTAMLKYSRALTMFWIKVMYLAGSKGEMLSLAEYCTAAPYVGRFHEYGAYWGRFGTGSWNLWRASFK